MIIPPAFISWYYSFRNGLLKEHPGKKRTFKTSALIQKSGMQCSPPIFLEYLNIVMRNEQNSHLHSPITFKRYTKRTDELIFTIATNPNPLPDIFLYLHQPKRPKLTHTFPLATDSMPFSDFMPSVLEFPSVSTHSIELDKLHAQVLQLTTEKEILQSQVDYLQEHPIVVGGELDIILQEFNQFFHKSTAIWSKYTSTIEKLKFTDLLTQMQQSYPHLYSFLRKAVLSTGSFRNTIKTSNRKLLAGLFHLSGLANLRNQNQNTCQFYFSLVLMALGCSKATISVHNTLGLTVSYKTAKLFLDNRAQQELNNIAQFFRECCSVLMLWDNYAFQAKVKHSRTDHEAKFMNCTVRAAIELAPPSPDTKIEDFVCPSALMDVLESDVFELTPIEKSLQINMVTWVLSRSLKSNSVLDVNKIKFEATIPLEARAMSLSLMYEDETSNKGTEAILDQFSKEFSIGGHEKTILEAEAAIQAKFLKDRSKGCNIEIAEYIEKNKSIKNPARMYALGAGDCVTFQRANENSREVGCQTSHSLISTLKRELTHIKKKVPLIMNLGMFHVVWHYLKVLHLIYWNFGYRSMLALVNHKWVGLEAKVFTPSDECFQMIFNGLLRAFLKEVKKAYALEFDAMGKKELTNEQKVTTVLKFIDMYIAKGKQEKDEYFEIWTDFLFVRGMLYQGCRNAVRFAQHSLIKSYVKSMVSDFFAVGKSPNANMILKWLCTLATVPPYWANLMLENLTLSMTGRKNHNVALDYYNERMVDAISRGCDRFACSPKTAARVSCNASLLHEIRRAFESEFDVNKSTSTHTTLAMEKEIQLLANQVEKVGMFVITPNRAAADYLCTPETNNTDGIEPELTERIFTKLDNTNKKNGKVVSSYAQYIELSMVGKIKKNKYFLVKIKNFRSDDLTVLHNVETAVARPLAALEKNIVITLINEHRYEKGYELFEACRLKLQFSLRQEGALYCNYCGKKYVLAHAHQTHTKEKCKSYNNPFTGSNVPNPLNQSQTIQLSNDLCANINLADFSFPTQFNSVLLHPTQQRLIQPIKPVSL